MIRLFFSVCLVFFGATAIAFDENTLSLSPDVQRGDIYKPDGLWPFLGIGLGVMDYNNNIRTGGVPGHVKVLGSYYFKGAPWVADFGLGLHNEFLTQKGSGSNTIQSLYTELAGRYEFTDRWQVGAVWSTLVDNPDRYHSNTENLASFVGLELMKEFTWGDAYVVRAGGRAMTDVGISGETVDTVMAELQVSFGKSQPAIVEAPIPTPAPRPIAEHLTRQAIKTFDLDPKNVNFDTDSTRLVSSSKTYLKHLARALADNRHLFDRVQVVGHADQRGTSAYNERLSARRAQAIGDALIDSGVQRSQIIMESRGERDLLTSAMTPTALLKNRRVQLKFHGVKNEEALNNILNAVID